jgi:hypothetical protein
MLTGLNFSPTHFTSCAEMNFNQLPLHQIENGNQLTGSVIKIPSTKFYTRKLKGRLKLQSVIEILIENI